MCPSGLRLLRDRFVRLHSDLLSRANGGVRCLGRIGSPSKSRRQKIHEIEYVEIRLGLSAESCAGSSIFNVGETMFWSVRIGIDHDARCRRALSRPGSRFYLTGEIVTPPRCLHHLFYIWILYYMYIAVIYARQIDMTFNSFSFTKYYWILLSVAYNFILIRIFQFFKFIMCHLILFPPIFSIFLIYNVPTVSTAIRPLNIFTKELNFLPKKYFISWKMWYLIRQISNFSVNQCISD